MTDKEVLLPISVPKDINQYDSYAAYCYGWNDCEKDLRGEGLDSDFAGYQNEPRSHAG